MDPQPGDQVGLRIVTRRWVDHSGADRVAWTFGPALTGSSTVKTWALWARHEVVRAAAPVWTDEPLALASRGAGSVQA